MCTKKYIIYILYVCDKKIKIKSNCPIDATLTFMSKPCINVFLEPYN